MKQHRKQQVILVLQALITVLWLSLEAEAVNRVTVESKTVSTNQTGIQIRIKIENDVQLAAIVVPLEIRSSSGSASIATILMTFDERLKTYLQLQTRGRLASPTGTCKPGGYVYGGGFGSSPLAVAAMPEGVLASCVWGAEPSPLPPGVDNVGSILLTLDIGPQAGILTIDTTCSDPSNHLAFVNTANQIVLPVFVAGIITVTSCLQQPAGSNMSINNQDDQFGYAIAAGKDISLVKDGKPDYAIGAPSSWHGCCAGEGEVFVYDGVTNAQLGKLWGDHDQDQFGYAVHMAGDMNHDGRAELIIGAPNYLNSTVSQRIGAVYVYTNNGATWPQLYSYSAGALNDRFGHAVSSCDFDGDGTDDIIIGAPFRNVSTTIDRGDVTIYSGSTGAYITSVPLIGPDGRRLAGFSVSGGLDYNGDGRQDVLIGSPGISGSTTGRITLLSHNPASPTTPGQSILVPASLNTELFGWSVDWIFQDGTGAYLAVGSPGYSSARGKVELRRATSDGLMNLLHIFSGEFAGDHFGSKVAKIGDVDGDCLPDIAISASDYNMTPKLMVGKVYIYSSATYALIASYTPSTVSDNEVFGSALADLGDPDNDKLRNLLIGAPFWSAPVSGIVYRREIGTPCGNSCSCCIGSTGNVDGSGDDVVDISDVFAMVDYLGSSLPLSSCGEENDVNKDATIDISDLFALIDYLSGAAPLPVCP